MASRHGSSVMTGFASLDPEALATLRALDQDNPGAFSQFVRMFVGEAPELVRKLEAAVANHDETARGQSAHYLRSASLALGATELAEICHALEHPGHAISDAEGAELLGRLRHSVRDALLALLSHVRQI
jgi:HPt (histidine-containing phosphotransfer) domain-containing protein